MKLRKSSTITNSHHARFAGGARGTASVEAVVALPTFILLLLCVFYVSHCVTKRHQAETMARTCAWYFSAAACDAEAFGESHPECSGLVSQVELDSSAGKELKRAVDKEIPDEWKGRASLLTSPKQFIGKAIENILTNVVTNRILRDSRATVKYEIQTLIRGDAEMATYQVSSQLPCNVLSKTPTELAEQAWNDSVDPYIKKAKSAMGL